MENIENSGITKNKEKPNESQISLRNLLTYDNPQRYQYDALTRNMLSVQMDPTLEKLQRADYSFTLPWENLTKTEKEYLKRKLKDGLLIDLGGNASDFRASSVMRRLSRQLGVKTYINVDYCHGGDINPYTSILAPDMVEPPSLKPLSKKEKSQTINDLLVNDDMLDFVSRLPDNSSNFAINGIDENSLHDQVGSYTQALWREILRSTKKGGVIFGVGSEIWRDSDEISDEIKFISKELGIESPDPRYSFSGYEDKKIIFEKSE